MKIKVLLGLALLAPAFMNAVELTVVHSTAGSFGSEMEAALADAGYAASEVTKLVVTGEAEMTFSDFAPIRNSMNETLKEIDLSQATFSKNALPGSGFDENGVLNGMVELQSAVLPDNLLTIGNGAFANCGKLENLNIPSTVTVVNHSAFRNCKKLIITSLPQGLEKVEPYGFAGCEALQVSSLPETLQQVMGYGFNTCRGLTASVIPASLTTIAEGGFATTGVTFSEWTEKLKSIGNKAFSGSKVTFKTWTPYVEKLPEGIFGYSTTLLDFTIPETITSIPKTAFYYEGSAERTFTCRNVTPPTAVDNDKAAWNNSFGPAKVYKKTTFRVKKEAMEAYQATAPYSRMNIVALTASMPVVVEGEGSVSTELGEVAEGVLPVYEGNTVITFVPSEGQTVSSVKYGEEELEVENNTVTVDCPQEPVVLTVVFSEESSVESIATDNVEITYDANRVAVNGYEGLIEVYGVNGSLLGSSYGSTLDISALESGVYVVRAGNVHAKILKH